MKATKRQRKLIGEYVRWMANELELRDWTFTVSREAPENDDFQATIECLYGRKYATIRFCDDFLDRPLETQRSTICHELIHAHLKGIEWQYNNIGNNLSTPLFEAIWLGIKDQIEFATDAMADAVAKHLPLPKQAKTKAAKAT